MQNVFIANTPEKASALVERLSSLTSNDVISVDTEFDRVRTYYPRLDLVQIAFAGDDSHQCYLADPHSTDITEILRALCDTKALCLFFSAREDFEIIAELARQAKFTKLLPENCLDLQLMQSFLNLGYSKGLQGSLKDNLNVEVEKDQTRSDWSVRPLSADQIRYACNDVLYLNQLYQFLDAKFSKDDVRRNWFYTEMTNFKFICTKEVDPDEAYLYVSGAGALKDRELVILKTLCKNRLKLGRKKNEALNRIITSCALCQISRLTNISEKALIDAGVKPGAVRQYGKTIIQWYLEGRDAPSCDLKKPVDSVAVTRQYNAPIKSLKKLLKAAALKNSISPEILCSRANCHDYFFCKDHNLKAKIESSWYRECVGDISYASLFS